MKRMPAQEKRVGARKGKQQEERVGGLDYGWVKGGAFMSGRGGGCIGEGGERPERFDGDAGEWGGSLGRWTGGGWVEYGLEGQRTSFQLGRGGGIKNTWVGTKKGT